MNGRLSIVCSAHFSPSILKLRECFKHGAFREKRIEVTDEFDASGCSTHRICFDGDRVVAASRETFFPARMKQCDGSCEMDLIQRWTGLELPIDEPRLIISRVVVSPDSDSTGKPYRGAGINERLFHLALGRARRMSVPLYCLVKSDLCKQRGTLLRMGFTEVASAVSYDIPGQPVDVVVLRNLPQRTFPLWHQAQTDTETQLAKNFPRQRPLFRHVSRVAERQL